MLEIFSQICNLVQGQNDCGRVCCTPAISNYCNTNRREITSFWMIFKDIMLQIVHHSLVIIRGRTWNRNFFSNFNTLPKLFLILFPRLFFLLLQEEYQ